MIYKAKIFILKFSLKRNEIQKIFFWITSFRQMHIPVVLGTQNARGYTNGDLRRSRRFRRKLRGKERLTKQKQVER